VARVLRPQLKSKPIGQRPNLGMNTIWAALALVLVIEGLLPFISPSGWRRMFEQVLRLNDGQIRFYGVASITAGLILLWLLS
jgi:uncharacterized protein